MSPKRNIPTDREKAVTATQHGHGRKQTSPVDNVHLRFISCGRCSYLMAAYRLLYSAEMAETVVQVHDRTWLKLCCGPQARTLISNAFGSRIDIDAYYFEGLCPECKRPFIYHAAENGEETPSLQISL
jgi:hypothetical protein